MKWYDFLRPRNWGIVKVYRDFENFNDWKRTIRKEQANINSPFNKWKLSRTKLFDVYTTLSLEDADMQLPENIQRMKLMEMLKPLHKYLDEDLGFVENLSCEFNQFEDDNHTLTQTYLVLYRFDFKKFSLKWLSGFIVKFSILLFFILHFKIITWILHLI